MGEGRAARCAKRSSIRATIQPPRARRRTVESVFVFFGDYGLLAYDVDGRELWRQPLGPFNNIYGMGASPIVVDDLVVLACDQSTGSFIVAFDKKTGQRAVAHAASRGAQRTLDADRLCAAARAEADPPAGIVSVERVRGRHRQAALVGRRPVVRAEVRAGDRRRHALHQRLRIRRERARPPRRRGPVVRSVPGERQEQGSAS